MKRVLLIPPSEAKWELYFPTNPGRKPVQKLKPVPKHKMSALNRALVEAIPALQSPASLSSKLMDMSFQRAIQSETCAEFKAHYLEANVVKRFQSTDRETTEQRSQAAIAKLLDSEVRCRFTNEALTGIWESAWVANNATFRRTMARARNIVRRILGKFPWEELPRACNFGPGATSEFSRKRAALHNKWASSAQITASAMPYLLAFEEWAGLDLEQPCDAGIVPRVAPRWSETCSLVEANKVFTVPKNFERDRVATKCVTWNLFFQKGVGKLIRRRLQREKLLLADAGEFHRVLAKLGSATGGLATLDLSSASDNIALALVEALLPQDWYQVILDLREEWGLLPDGNYVRWEKVSSMGNGFTFELETLLFYAIVRACCSKGSLVSLYGDDIICPVKYVDKVVEVMSFCGFEFNREKTFTTGPFRESCGGHFWGGVDVKPFYIKNLPNDVVDVINLHNDVVRWYGRYPREGDRFFRVWQRCREIVPRKAWGPPGLQGVLWAEWDDCRPVYHKAKQAFSICQASAVSIVDFDDRCVGRYLQNLWEKSDDIEDINHSSYRETGEELRWVLRYVDRAQWNRVTAETLCT